jgi:hypothetical protein
MVAVQAESGSSYRSYLIDKEGRRLWFRGSSKMRVIHSERFLWQLIQYAVSMWTKKRQSRLNNTPASMETRLSISALPIARRHSTEIPSNTCENQPKMRSLLLQSL